MSLADRIRTARALPEALLHQMAPKTWLCVMPTAAYEATVRGLSVTVTLLGTGECARYVLEQDEAGRCRLPGVTGYWTDLPTAARDLALLAALDGQPADLSHLTDLEVAA